MNLEDTTKSWDTDPKRWTGRLLYIPGFAARVSPSMAARWYISSNTATQLVIANDWAYALNGNPAVYYILEQTYREYVLDTERTRAFAPLERRPLDQYDFAMSLLRYEA